MEASLEPPPTAVPGSRREIELEVLDVNFAPRAQRRLRRHAAAARLPAGEIRIDDCVDVEAEQPLQGSPAVPAVDVICTGGLRRGRRGQEPPAHSTAALLGRAASGSASSASAPSRSPRRPAALASGGRREVPPHAAGGRLGRNRVTFAVNRGTVLSRPAALAGRRPAVSRSSRRPPQAPPGTEPLEVLEDSDGPAADQPAGTLGRGPGPPPEARPNSEPSDASLTNGEAEQGAQSREAERLARPRWVIPDVAMLIGELDREAQSQDAHLYVELVRNGMFPSCCSACHEPFLVGTLRLGYAACGSARTPNPPPMWIHVPRCIRLANFVLQEADHVRFSPFVPAYAKEHVLDALAMCVLRESAGLPRPRATRAWHYEPAAMERWRTSSVPRPPTPPPTPPPPPPSPASPSPPASRPSPLPLPRLPAQEASGAGAAQGVSPALLNAMPVECLSERAPEPCVVCWEPLLPKEEARRLPCLHLFHRLCIDRWLSVRASCPLDNLRLDEALGYPPAGQAGASGAGSAASAGG